MIGPKDLDFTGRRVLVTGAASGFGAEMARAFAGHGATLVLADRTKDGLEAIAREVGAEAAHVYDQADLASVAGLAAAAGAVDVLMNNAGIGLPGALLSQSPEGIQRVIQVDLVGPIVLATAIAKGMAERRRGVIVNTASQLAFHGSAGRGAYAAAKAGMVQFTKSAAAEWAPHGVRVVAIGPGISATALTATRLADPAQHASVLDQIPMRRVGTAPEIANLALFLASDVADYVVGETLIADGGYILL